LIAPGNARETRAVTYARPAAATSRLLFLASSGHSGSTLLEVMLGNHPLVSSVGEVHRLSIYPYTRMCACGEVIARCAYWNDIAAAVAQRLGAPTAVTWDTFLLDMPPSKPLFRLPRRFQAELERGGAPSDGLRDEFRRAGVELSASVRTGRGAGVRETGCFVRDDGHDRKFLVRHERDELSVYLELRHWKNPFRLPSLLDLAVVSGSRRLTRALAHISAEVRQQLACAANSWLLNDVIASTAGTPWIVDSTKSPARLKLLQLERPDALRVACLVRDGRAVVASAVRRTGITVEKAARIWVLENKRIDLVTRTIPAHHRHRLSYEAFCADPAAVLKGVCAFLALPFDPGMVALWTRPIHSIPGNPLLFNRERRTIAVDERWRRELSANDLEVFNRIAGPLNRRLGYQS
jgi:sulfotransferase family protein